jgi:hypothetical protein
VLPRPFGLRRLIGHHSQILRISCVFSNSSACTRADMSRSIPHPGGANLLARRKKNPLPGGPAPQQTCCNGLKEKSVNVSRWIDRARACVGSGHLDTRRCRRVLQALAEVPSFGCISTRHEARQPSLAGSILTRKDETFDDLAMTIAGRAAGSTSAQGDVIRRLPMAAVDRFACGLIIGREPPASVTPRW